MWIQNSNAYKWLKVSKSQKQISKFSFEPKTNDFFCIAALASKMSQFTKKSNIAKLCQVRVTGLKKPILQRCAKRAGWNATTITWFTDYGRPMKPFSLKSRTFGLGQTNWADQFWGIWGYQNLGYNSESLVHVFHLFNHYF